MKHAKPVGILALFVALVATLPVRAAEPAVPAYVLLIGIDQYADDNILPRQHAEADVKALYNVFTSPERLGVAATRIRLLLGKPDKKRPSQTATHDNILQALKWLQTVRGKDDLVVFAYIGQGAPLGKRLCFFASDSTFKERKKNAIASGDIEQALDKLKSERFVAFFDVSFLGFKNAKKLGLDPDLSDLRPMFFGKDVDKEDGKPKPGRVFFLGGGIKPSVELDKHGLFSQVLLDGLKGKADTEGYEPDGVVTVRELAKYFEEQLPALARKQGKNDEEKDQYPGAGGLTQTTDFVLVRNPAAYSRAHERVLKFEKMAKEADLTKEMTEEGVNLLSRMPKLEAKQNLRKAYQKLADGALTVADFQSERKEILASTMLSEGEAKDYAHRVYRAVQMVRKGFVKPVNSGQLVDYAIRGMYQELNEKLPSGVRERLDKIKSIKEEDVKEANLIKLLVDARTHLGKREDLAKNKDITLSLHPMLHKLDKHTDYIDPDTLMRLQQEIEGQFTGIGVQIRKNNIKDQLQVVTPIRNTPAYKAGLYAGDIITTIVREVDSEGKPLDSPEILPTKGMSTDQAVKKIIGKAGTKVKLIVEREGEAKPLEFNLIRGKITVETILGSKRKADDTWDYVIDPENKICYVRLTQFSHNTYDDLRKIMAGLAKKGIKGFILDLRFNPGGLLDSAVRISDLFIEDGMIVTIRPRNGPETSYVGHADGRFSTFPMVCLVNGYSASASEIVSACLQDHGRAIIMGSRSYGKGSVQTIHPFSDTGGRLKLTTATFWRPVSDPKTGKGNLNKTSTPGRDEDEWGVKPDPGYTLKLSMKELNDLQDHQRDREIIHRPDKRNEAKSNGFHDRQLEMALEYLRGQIKTAAKGSSKKAG
jgi:C-terminal peptidase prc